MHRISGFRSHMGLEKVILRSYEVDVVWGQLKLITQIHQKSFDITEFQHLKVTVEGQNLGP